MIVQGQNCVESQNSGYLHLRRKKTHGTSCGKRYCIIFLKPAEGSDCRGRAKIGQERIKRVELSERIQGGGRVFESFCILFGNHFRKFTASPITYGGEVSSRLIAAQSFPQCHGL